MIDFLTRIRSTEMDPSNTLGIDVYQEIDKVILKEFDTHFSVPSGEKPDTFKHYTEYNSYISNQNEIKLNFSKVFSKILSIINPNNELASLVREQCFLAGGAIRNFIIRKEINDFDIYFKSRIAADEFSRIVLLADEKCNLQSIFTDSLKIVSKTDNAITLKSTDLNSVFFKHPIQFITKVTGNPSFVVKTFDFTNCMGYYDPDDGGKIEISQMLNAIKWKKLYFNSNSDNPLSSLKRLVKFQYLGFKATEKCLLDILTACQKLSKEEIEKFKSGKHLDY